MIRTLADQSLSGSDELMNDILEMLQAPESSTPGNILLLGKTGSGKSSLVNTLHKAITGRYYRIAFQGKGDRKSVTLDLTRYENCGVKAHRVSDADRRSRLRDVVTKLPHIWDCAGLGNESSPKIREFLQLLIAGYIRPGTSIGALEEMQKTYGIGRLKHVLKGPNPEWKMSKVVFVLSCNNEIPKNLIGCLRDVIQEYDKTTWTRKYQFDVFAVITKCDLVQDANETDEISSGNEETVSRKEFKSFEDEAADQFNFGGALESHRFKWVSFNDAVGYEGPEVDKSALQFLKRMIEPGVPKTTYNDAPLVEESIKVHAYRFAKLLEDLFFQLMNIIQNNPDNPAVIGGVILVASIIFCLFYRLMNAAI